MKYQIISLQPNKIEDRSVVVPFRYLERKGIIQIKYLEFSFLKQALRILRSKENSPLLRTLKNIYGVMELLISKGKTIIVGAEPFSELTFVINRLKARHRCIYFTSWPWDEETFSHRVLGAFRKTAWCKFLDGMLCVSVNKVPCEALSNYGAHVFHIPHAVDTEIFRPEVSKPSSVEIKVLFVGELLKLKGIHLIIKIIKKNKWENIKFCFVGKGPYKKEIRNMQKENYPVRYYGYVENRKQLAGIFHDSDILILPSIKMGRIEEKFGIVLIEAMACQLPVIASDCVGPKQIIENGKTGILIPQNDEMALRDAIFELAKDSELRAKLGKNGRKRVENVYNVEIVAKKWLEVIERVNRISIAL